MTHFVTEACRGCHFTTCVDVCPVACFHEGEDAGERMVVIDPQTCIDCGLCVRQCPVRAIKPDRPVSAVKSSAGVGRVTAAPLTLQDLMWLGKNKTLAQAWPVLKRSRIVDESALPSRCFPQDVADPS